MRKSELSGTKMFQSNIHFYAHKSVYCVYTRNLGANQWLLLGQSLCLLGACLWLGWVQSMRKLGAKYMDTFGCMSMPFGCMSMDRLGACMRLLGAKYAATFGCMPDSR